MPGEAPVPPPADGAAPENKYQDANAPQARFLDQVEHLRPRLHRYCSRMLGSVLDGEDIVQDTLAAAWFRLDKVDAERPLGPLLFRIAHNRCIDVLRRRRFVSDTEPAERADGHTPESSVIDSEQVRGALRYLLTHLAPRERSCFVLKDVLGFSLAEVSEIVGCGRGAVKSALSRGRAKLSHLRAAGEVPSPSRAKTDPERDRAVFELLSRYAQHWNAQNWSALADLLAEDVRLDVVGISEDNARDVLFGEYRSRYKGFEGTWRLVPGLVDREPVLLCVRQRPGEREESVAWPVRFEMERGRITRVRDYAIQGRILKEADFFEL